MTQTSCPKVCCYKVINMNEEDKKAIIQDINLRIGNDVNDLTIAYDIENELVNRRDYLQSCLNVANNEVPTKLSSAIKKAERNSKQIENIKLKSEQLKIKVKEFLNRNEPLRTELDKRFTAINKLEDILMYLKSFEKIESLSNQMKQTSEDEQAIQLYGELKDMCAQYQNGHRGNYLKDYTHYWHNILKDKLMKQYEDVLKLLKWPFTSGIENSPPPKEILMKFNNLTRYLFLVQEPEDLTVGTVSGDFSQEQNPCLPVRLLLLPLKKRFAFHFTGSRQTARIDRPEWFFTQILTWIKDHQTFVHKNVQPIADKLEMKSVRAGEEFNAGLIALAAERLHTVLGLYHAQSARGTIGDVDAAFAHAVDETLGFHKELVTITGSEVNTVLSVLTKAETFLKWLAVEKKYALAKMDEMLGSELWSEPVGAGVGAAVGCALWVPRAAHAFVDLLATIEKRYALLPQPGHRLQFLELQLELVEEWRVRLSQLQHAALAALPSPGDAAPARRLAAVVNAAHHTRAVLLQWTHSLHYLQLHYYRRQFQHFTQQQHHDEETESSSSSEEDDEEESDEENNKKSTKMEGETDEAMSLKEVEARAKKLALNEISRRNSMLNEQSSFDITSPIANLAVTDPLPNESADDETGVFGDAPALFAHLRDAGLAALAEHILLEFKALLRDYKKQKWHAMLMVEQMALSVSAALCRPLAALCARLAAAGAQLAPPLALRLRAALALQLDHHVFEEIVLDNWFNTGGTMQFTHDVKRNLIPAFVPPNKMASQAYTMPKLLEACKLLNMDYDDARRLRATLAKQPAAALESLISQGIKHILPNEALQILNQRTDLNDSSSPSSVMELF